MSCLISNGADVDACSSFNPVFSIPSENGYADVNAAKVRTINTNSDNGVTPLMIAAREGRLNVVTLLIKEGVDVSLPDYDGRTALHFAAGSSENSCEILSCLIENGADINKGRNDNQTPLMVAAENGHVSVATFLIEHGADVDLQDNDGKTALHHAFHGSDVSCEILSCLIGIGADVNARTNNTGTPLMIAAEKGHINAVTSLVECGANVDLQDKDGQTALHHAMQSPQASICEVLSCLIKNGADVNAHTFHIETPLMLASRDGHVNVVTFLIKHGADVDLQHKDGDTALHYAASFSDVFPEIVETLLNLGASHMCNHQGLTPLHQASITGNTAVVKCLIERPGITREQRVDALELLGASCATQYNKFRFHSSFANEGLMYIKRGMEERFVDPSQPILKQPKKPAYGNRKESQTPEELAQIEGDTEAILMESLLIKERILGTNHSELLRSIRFVCSSCNLTDPSLLIALYSRAVDIAQKSNLSAHDDFQKITYLLRKIMSRGSNHLKEEDFLELLRQIVIEYKMEHTKRRRNDDEKYLREEVLEDLFFFSLRLVSIMSKFEFCDERNASKVSKLLEELSSQDPRNSSGNSLLHVFIERCSVYNDSSSCLQAVNLLLNEGFNVNVVNNEGNSPLHIAVTLEPRNEKIYLLTEILRLLFDGGAHHDFVNNDSKTPMDMVESVEAAVILSERRTLGLKCISAKAVKKFEIPYLGVVPKILGNYISRH